MWCFLCLMSAIDRTETIYIEKGDVQAADK
jgi:hypothetical protein